MTRDYLKHISISPGLGFVVAALLCISEKQGFDAACVYQGIGAMATVMGTYMAALQLTPPGKVVLPADFAEKFKEGQK